MFKVKRLTTGFIVLLLIIMTMACTDHDSVPLGECNTVVEHAQKVLGDLSPSYEDLRKSCEDTSGDKRGCILNADTIKEMRKCS